MPSYYAPMIPFPLQESCSIPDSLGLWQQPLPTPGFMEQAPTYTLQKQKMLMHSLTTNPKLQNKLILQWLNWIAKYPKALLSTVNLLEEEK